DLTDVGKSREAEVLGEDLHVGSIPVIGVLGNHDYESGQVEDVEKILKAAGVHLLNGQSYETNGVAFVGVKGFIGGFGRRMLASFGESIVKGVVAESVAEAMRLENAMRTVRIERTERRFAIKPKRLVAADQTRIVSVARIRLDSWTFVRPFKGIFCADISEIAVGTLITERPPHRTERAPFGHSAPTSGV